VIRVLVAFLLLAVVITPALAQAPVTLAFATLDAGSAWYVYGATMAELLREALPAGSNVDVKPFAGGVGNAKLVAKNETPLALSFTVTNRWAYEGKEAYDAKLDGLRGLVGGLDTYYLVAVVQKKLGINSLKDVKDKKIASASSVGVSCCARTASATPTFARGAAIPTTSATTSS